MRTIKTRNRVKSIKILDRPANLSKRMKDSFIRTKEKAEETQNSSHDSPTEYASENIQSTAQDAAYNFQNPHTKMRENLDRAKGHFEEVKSQMPGERTRTAEQAKVKAESLRKTADKAHKTASEAKTAAKDAKNTLREVRQNLKEVKQSNSGGTLREKMLRFHSQKLKNKPQTTNIGQINMMQKTMTVAESRPNYLDKTVSAPKNAVDMAKTAKSTNRAVKETAKGTVKTAKKAVKTAEQSARLAAKTANQTAKTAKAAERAARASAKTAVKAAKVAAHAIVSLVKGAIAAVKGLVAAIAAGGWMAVLIILIICMIGLLLGSAFGIFFSSEQSASENSMSMNAVVSQLNTEFAGELAGIQRDNPHDRCEITANRALWKEILAIYAVKTSTDPDNPLEVMSLDDERIELLHTVFWDMNIIEYEIEEVEHYGEDEDEEDWTEYVLHITVTGKTAAEMAEQYNFNDKQREMLEELLRPEYDSLWASLLVGIPTEGNGTQTISLGIYIWPSNSSNYVTSFFGTRVHPITEEVHHHTGVDIGAAFGTDVLAAADGEVTLAGWNGEYGYCVIIEHEDGHKTLYGHMSSLNTSVGDAVIQGQTIGFVGSTGTSTGPHIHLETFVKGSRVDPLLYFDNYTAAW